MDEFAERLRKDAEEIDAQVSAGLDHRIQASLRAVEPCSEPGVDTAPGYREKPRRGAQGQRPERSTMFWWVSSLTGAAAAIVMITTLNLNHSDIGHPSPGGADPAALASTEAVATVQQGFPIPHPVLITEAAMQTSPLEQELEDLEADLKKARDAIRNDIDLAF